MKFTIEKGLSIYDLNDAIKFFMVQHDFGELRNVTLEDDLVINIFADNYEERCREWILPELWEDFRYEIENEIDRCEKANRIVNKRIEDAPQKIKKRSTLEKYKNDKIKFEEYLRKLQEVQKLYYALKEVDEREYENINEKYGFVITYNGKKYAFVHQKDGDRGVLLELGQNTVNLLEIKGYSFYGGYSV